MFFLKTFKIIHDNYIDNPENNETEIDETNETDETAEPDKTNETNETSSNANRITKTLFYFTFIIWSLYGVVYLFTIRYIKILAIIY